MEPISSGNRGVMGMILMIFWVLYTLGLSLVVFGRFLAQRPWLKLGKYGMGLLVAQLFLVLTLSFIYSASREWIWRF